MSTAQCPTVRSIGDVQIFSYEGRLEASVALEIRRALLERIDAGAHWLVMDFSKVEFIDSSGLSIFIAALKRASEAGGDTVLLDVSDPVRTILEITHLHQVFRVFEDESAAVSALQREAAEKA